MPHGDKSLLLDGGLTPSSRLLQRELMIDRGIHVAALAAAVIGSISLALSLRNADQILGVGLYLAGLFAMLGCSTLHNWPLATSHKELLRRLDHAVIFLMIAGTYSPFMIAVAEDSAFAAVFMFVWAAAIAGFIVKLTRPTVLERLSVALYLVVGWSGVVVLDRLADRLPIFIVWLLGIGGVLYSLGVIFHLWRQLPYQNAIWHGFVAAAGVTHYLAVAEFLRR